MCFREKPTRSTLCGLFARFQTFNLLSLELLPPESNSLWSCLLWLPLSPGILPGPVSQTFENYFEVGGIIFIHFTLQRKKKKTLMSSGYLWSVNSHCLLLDVCLLETWPRLEHPPLARGGGRERGRGVNFLIETPGKFMEDEKSSSKATPHNDPNEFMQMC